MIAVEGSYAQVAECVQEYKTRIQERKEEVNAKKKEVALSKANVDERNRHLVDNELNPD